MGEGSDSGGGQGVNQLRVCDTLGLGEKMRFVGDAKVYVYTGDVRGGELGAGFISRGQFPTKEFCTLNLGEARDACVRRTGQHTQRKKSWPGLGGQKRRGKERRRKEKLDKERVE